MELHHHIEAFHHDLANAASLGDEATRQAASRLLIALDPALRMAMVDLLSTACTQLSAELGDTLVEVRMNGREPQFAVTRQQPSSSAPVQPEPEGDDSSLSRVTLRLPESLKLRAEEASARQGTSLNTWLVDAVRSTLNARPSHSSSTAGRRLTGWA